VDGDENSTELVMRTLKNTERVYKNKTSTLVKAIEAEHPGDIDKIIHLVKGENYRQSFQVGGDGMPTNGFLSNYLFEVERVFGGEVCVRGRFSDISLSLFPHK
jgi:nitronate monooxygenase